MLPFLLQTDTTPYDAGYSTGHALGIFISIIGGGALYFLPALLGRNKRQAMPIFLVNLLLGWTIVGWIGALIWAVSADAAPAVIIRPAPAAVPTVADELTKLQQLADAGTLTAEEFQREKARVLNQAHA